MSAPVQQGDTRPGPPPLFDAGPAGVLRVSDPDEVRRQYREYRLRILFWATIGYAAFYFVRKNLPVAMPEMENHLGVTKSSLGLFLTLHGLLYGVSKFVNGFLGDRVNARIFMALGLFTSAAMNVCFGFSSAATTLGVFWMLNGWFQGMGFPPCARLMTHWFPPRELATKMSLWNTSHTIGAAAVVVLCGYLVAHDWRWCFWGPGAVAAVMAVLVLLRLPDTPESVGLPEVEGTEPVVRLPGRGAGGTAFRSVLARKVFGNPYIWLLSLANFFVYTVRYGVLDWGPTLLKEAKGIELSHGSWMIAGFEAAGLVGMLLTGWLTDRVFGGRGARMCCLCMLLCGLALFAFRFVPAGSIAMNTALLMAAGFLIYGPQALVGIAAANLATKRAAATAVGLTGLFGYASTVLSGWGLGLLVQGYGWDAGLQGLVAMSLAGMLLFLAAWPARAHGYESPSEI